MLDLDQDFECNFLAYSDKYEPGEPHLKESNITCVWVLIPESDVNKNLTFVMACHSVANLFDMEL